MPIACTEMYEATMQFGKIARASFCVVVLVVAFNSSTGCKAQNPDAKLKKRISELEAENKALRQVLGQLQNALQAIPKSVAETSPAANGLRLIVMPGDWGGSSLVDMRKVCESAAGTIAAQLNNDSFAPIVIERGKNGPITLYRRGKGYEYIVHLDTSDRAWAQLAYQFAHEFCHIVCNLRDAKNSQLWFEESLCECASLFALRKMADQWKANPPYSNWKSYAASLSDYAKQRIEQNKDQIDPDVNFAKFYRTNRTELESNGTNRKLNTRVAIELLPIFESEPQAWEALRYINLGAAEENNSFETYLSSWHQRVPPTLQPVVEKIAAKFEIAVN